MNKEIGTKIDCLLEEIVKVKMLEEKQKHNMPLVDDLFKRHLMELFVTECRVALTPMLRDMISRGHAVELIKQHFGVGDKHE